MADVRPGCMIDSHISSMFAPGASGREGVRAAKDIRPDAKGFRNCASTRRSSAEIQQFPSLQVSDHPINGVISRHQNSPIRCNRIDQTTDHSLRPIVNITYLRQGRVHHDYIAGSNSGASEISDKALPSQNRAGFSACRPFFRADEAGWATYGIYYRIRQMPFTPLPNPVFEYT